MKTPSPQKAAAIAFANKVAHMSDEQRADFAAQVPAIYTIDGRALSVRNILLVGYSIESATIIGGYRQWQAAGRQVKQGEHAAYIFAPRIRKDSAGEDSCSGFVLVPVFDVSQTEAIAQAQAA